MSGETRIDELDPSEPTGLEPVSEGDDQIRGIKGGLDGTFPNFEGLAGAPATQVLKTENEINDAPEKGLDGEVISGDWEFTGEVKFSGGQFGIEIANGTGIRGRNIADSADIPLVSVGNGGPTADKAIFGATNAESVYEGDDHEFNGDVTLVASTTGAMGPGNLTIPGGLTSAARLEFEDGIATTTESNLTPSALNVGIPVYLPNGTFVGWIQMFSGLEP